MATWTGFFVLTCKGWTGEDSTANGQIFWLQATSAAYGLGVVVVDEVRGIVVRRDVMTGCQDVLSMGAKGTCRRVPGMRKDGSMLHFNGSWAEGGRPSTSPTFLSSIHSGKQSH